MLLIRAGRSGQQCLARSKSLQAVQAATRRGAVGLYTNNVLQTEYKVALL